MSERLKKFLLISVFILVVAGIGYFLYRLFFKPAAPTLAPSVSPQATGVLPSAGNATSAQTVAPLGQPGLPTAQQVAPLTLPPPPTPPSRTEVLSDQVLNSITVSPSGGLRGYNPVDGKFYHVTSDGKSTALSDQTFYNVQSVDWANKTDKAILSYPDGSKTLYDFSSQKQVTLPAYWENFSFSPQDSQIAAKSVGNNETNRFLVVANPDGSSAKAVEDLGQNQDKVHVDWAPNNQTIAYAFTGEAEGLDRQSVILVGQNHENFKSLEVEGRGFVPNWSPSGNNVLYSVYSTESGFRPELWISGAVGDSINANRRDLAIQTWADKCAWQNETTLYCAVPTSLDEGAGLQPDIAASTPDAIYKIDLKNGTKTNLGSPDGNPTIDKFVISPDGKSAYYTDFTTGKVMRFAL
ncbi:MAG TPA: hypothetical protein VFQ60_05530 [Patescibacteria group bacterium]|nr:hypothetical protein [Patescibacteria group bacterium]